MKRLKKLAALVLTGAMALTMLAGCGGNNSGSKSHDEELKLINAILEEDGFETVTESSSLSNKAEDYVELMEQIKEIPVDVANDPYNADYDVIRGDNSEIQSERGEMIAALYQSKILLFDDIGSDSYTSPDKLSEDSERADKVASILEELQTINDGYYVGGEDDANIGPVKIKSIGIATVTDMPENVYANRCKDKCEHENSVDSCDDNYLAHTQEYNGWIVLVQYE